MINLGYWKAMPNVGDYFSFWLAKKLYKEVEYSRDPNLIITGSILAWPDLTNKTIVWGAGFHNIEPGKEFCRITKKDNFRAVRGKLSANKLKIDDIVLGDPGLLASKYYKPKVNKKWKYTLLCHWRDYQTLKNKYKEINVVNMATNNIEAILKIINESCYVLSTSLHGIIFAHSYGIPAIHVENNCLESKDNFKFKDYYSVLDIPYFKYKLTLNCKKDLENISKLEIKSPSQSRIQEIQENLLRVLPKEEEFELEGDVAICAIAKNENKYINDWVEYYLNLNVDHIFLFDNNDYSTYFVGNCIKNKEKVTIFDINSKKEKALQLKSYNYFYEKYSKYYKWIIFVDIDEFISGISDFKTFLNNTKFDNYEMIRIKWKLFGDDNKVTRDLNVPVYKAFIKPIENHSKSNQGKCIVRGGLPNICIGSCHYAFRGKPNFEKLESRDLTKSTQILKSCLPSGRPCYSRITITEDYSAETVFVNHYMTKTISEFINQKLNRGDACFDSRKIDLSYFWDLNTKTTEKIKYVDNLFNPKKAYIEENITDSALPTFDEWWL